MSLLYRALKKAEDKDKLPDSEPSPQLLTEDQGAAPGRRGSRNKLIGFLLALSFVVIGGIAGLLAPRLGTESASATAAAGGIAIDAAIAEHGAVGAIAQPLYTTYVVPFEITGILLLVAIVGAVALAKKEV